MMFVVPIPFWLALVIYMPGWGWGLIIALGVMYGLFYLAYKVLKEVYTVACEFASFLGALWFYATHYRVCSEVRRAELWRNR